MISETALEQSATITLTVAELVALSELLGRLNKQETLTPFVDNSEQVAIWALENALERENPFVFNQDYEHILQRVKSHLTRGIEQ